MVPGIDKAARCKTCGYQLRGLDDHRCPECGRVFDPADPATMDLGRHPGRLGRLLLRPTGWVTTGVLVLGSVLTLTTFRFPVAGTRPAWVDMRLYRPGPTLLDRMKSVSDWGFAIALWVVAAATLLVSMRSIGRLAARRWYRRTDAPVNFGRRSLLALMAWTAAGGAIGFGWPYRIARYWVRGLLAAYDAGTLPNWNPNRLFTPVPGPPVVLSPAQHFQTLRAALVQLPTPRERLAALKLLIEQSPADGPALLPEAIAAEKDSALRATELRLLGLYREPLHVSVLMQYWDDPDPAIRAAATDAVGLIHAPAFPPLSTATDPTIDLDSFERSTDLSATAQSTLKGVPLPPMMSSKVFWPEEQPLPERVRERLMDRLLHGVLLSDREAAARSLLKWPRVGKFRFAEWGVFLAHGGKISLVQPQLDEIPPFVHRAGQTLKDLQTRTGRSSNISVFKPVVHLTTDRAMAVDIQSTIAKGRVWYVYPRPDDLVINDDGSFWNPSLQGISTAGTVPFLQQFDPVGFLKLEDLREGYPWQTPSHRTAYSPAPVYDPYVFSGVGVRWQSLIVSPEKLPWMTPPAVPGGPKCSWWDRLRRVPCSWVSSRGESERFLYYDGPSSADPPLTFSYSDRKLVVGKGPLMDSGALLNAGTDQLFEPTRTPTTRPEDNAPPDPSRVGLFIDVASDGRVDGAVVSFDQPSGDPSTIDLRDQPFASGGAVADLFRSMLTTAGLTADEAAGMVDSWRDGFFVAPGKRFLLLLHPDEYDFLCPIRIEPTPTEMVRVGLFWTEFD